MTMPIQQPDQQPELRCSEWSRRLDEPLAGTAGTARGYLAIEQAGPWGRNALLESRLDHSIAEKLTHHAAELGLGALAIRPTGRSADHHHAGGRTVLAALGGTHQQLVSFQVDHAKELLDLDWTAFGELNRTTFGGADSQGGEAERTTAGDADLTHLYPGAELIEEPVALVCSHAKRDRCCALAGRPIAAHLAARFPGQVWETSHLGGHRFAPTMLVLPLGVVYGRLDADTALAAYQAAGRAEVIPQLLRGLARYSHPVQAAEVAVREAARIIALDYPRLIGSEQHQEVTLARFRDEEGGTWQVEILTQPVDQPRPESCAKPAGLPLSNVVRRIGRAEQASEATSLDSNL